MSTEENIMIDIQEEPNVDSTQTNLEDDSETVVTFDEVMYMLQIDEKSKYQTDNSNALVSTSIRESRTGSGTLEATEKSSEKSSSDIQANGESVDVQAYAVMSFSNQQHTSSSGSRAIESTNFDQK